MIRFEFHGRVGRAAPFIDGVAASVRPGPGSEPHINAPPR